MGDRTGCLVNRPVLYHTSFTCCFTPLFHLGWLVEAGPETRPHFMLSRSHHLDRPLGQTIDDNQAWFCNCVAACVTGVRIRKAEDSLNHLYVIRFVWGHACRWDAQEEHPPHERLSLEGLQGIEPLLGRLPCMCPEPATSTHSFSTSPLIRLDCTI